MILYQKTIEKVISIELVKDSILDKYFLIIIDNYKFLDNINLHGFNFKD